MGTVLPKKTRNWEEADFIPNLQQNLFFPDLEASHNVSPTPKSQTCTSAVLRKLNLNVSVNTKNNSFS